MKRKGSFQSGCVLPTPRTHGLVHCLRTLYYAERYLQQRGLRASFPSGNYHGEPTAQSSDDPERVGMLLSKRAAIYTLK